MSPMSITSSTSTGTSFTWKQVSPVCSGKAGLLQSLLVLLLSYIDPFFCFLVVNTQCSCERVTVVRFSEYLFVSFNPLTVTPATVAD